MHACRRKKKDSISPTTREAPRSFWQQPKAGAFRQRLREQRSARREKHDMRHNSRLTTKPMQSPPRLKPVECAMSCTHSKQHDTRPRKYTNKGNHQRPHLAQQRQNPVLLWFSFQANSMQRPTAPRSRFATTISTPTLHGNKPRASYIPPGPSNQEHAKGSGMLGAVFGFYTQFIRFWRK